MIVKEYENARSYLQEHETALLEHEAVSQLVLYSAYKNLDITSSEKCIFGAVMDEDKPVIHYCNVTPDNMTIYAENHQKESIAKASALLADNMAVNHIPIVGLNARQDICQVFIEHYKKNTNSIFLEKLGMDIMEIRKLYDITPVEGNHRLAAMDEVKLITDWMISFQLEALANEINYETALEHATKLIEENRFHVYEDKDQQPVSMAAVTRQLVHGVVISYVYTPEEFRGKGYAATNIYYMSKGCLEQGNEFCTLFVDKRNPLSTRAYEKVGYLVLEDNYEYKIMVT